MNKFILCNGVVVAQLSAQVAAFKVDRDFDVGNIASLDIDPGIGNGLRNGKQAPESGFAQGKFSIRGMFKSLINSLSKFKLCDKSQTTQPASGKKTTREIMSLPLAAQSLPGQVFQNAMNVVLSGHSSKDVSSRRVTVKPASSQQTTGKIMPLPASQPTDVPQEDPELNRHGDSSSDDFSKLSSLQSEGKQKSNETFDADSWLHSSQHSSDFEEEDGPQLLQHMRRKQKFDNFGEDGAVNLQDLVTNINKNPSIVLKVLRKNSRRKTMADTKQGRRKLTT